MISIRNFSESVSPGYKQYYLSKKIDSIKKCAKIKQQAMQIPDLKNRDVYFKRAMADLNNELIKGYKKESINEDAIADKVIRDKILADFEIVKNYIQVHLMSSQRATHTTNTIHEIIWGKDIDSESDYPIIHGFIIHLNKIIELPANLDLILLSLADTRQPIKGGIGKYKGNPSLFFFIAF